MQQLTQFQSTLPARGATIDGFNRRDADSNFNPRSPHGERRFMTWERIAADMISIHAPRTGSDPPEPPAAARAASNFNPRSPHGERQDETRHAATSGNFNPRSPHGERRRASQPPPEPPAISIHAPRTGSDRCTLLHLPSCNNFNPRSPHGERQRASTICARRRAHFNPRSPHGERLARPLITPLRYHFNPRSPHGERRPSTQTTGCLLTFQSTLPARGATSSTFADLLGSAHFNPRSPHGERLQPAKTSSTHGLHFNPRSPHGERLPTCVAVSSATPFQSTLPARGATRPELAACQFALHFNPRSPHGERRYHLLNLHSVFQFQSTLPARGATAATQTTICTRRISIHAPRTGSDENKIELCSLYGHFNPRSPHGERRAGRYNPGRNGEISIHAPRTGSDSRAFFSSSTALSFQSTLPARGATARIHAVRRAVLLISIHAPRTGSDVHALAQRHRLDISIHAPRTGSDLQLFDAFRKLRISIHAPRTGSDAISSSRWSASPHFNPRSPHGERRQHSVQIIVDFPFQSTLPARGATGAAGKETTTCRHFNPRSPHGERRCHAVVDRALQKFQSTLPARGATSSLTFPVQTS